MEKFVDVRKLIAGKNPKALKWLPEFVIRYVEQIIHQDELNEIFHNQKGKNAHEFSQASLEYFNISYEIKGAANIPPITESCIFVANHPLGGFDAITIIAALKDLRPDLMFIVNDFLLSVENLKERFVGVNKVGKNAIKSLQHVEKLFASEVATFIFPAGLVSRKIKGEVKDLTWKKTFISKAKKYQKPVVPVYIAGRLTNRFYRLANLRKFLGIKLNIEMFFLADELFKQKGNKMDIIFGRPIPPQTFDNTKSAHEWAQWVKDQVYRLPTEFNSIG